MRKCKCIRNFYGAVDQLLYGNNANPIYVVGKIYDYIKPATKFTYQPYIVYTDDGSYYTFYNDGINHILMNNYFVDVSEYRNEVINKIINEKM